MAAELTASRPLIGVTTSEVRFAARIQQTAQSEPPRREMALGLTYLLAIEAAGGLPVVMPPLELEAIEPLLDRLSGICLSGGPDLDPTAYSEQPHPHLGPTEPDLDRFELELARRADTRGLPILAICRGMQALNVARGGSLHQHLPDRPGVAIDHRQREGGDHAIHDVTIAPGSRLARLMRRDAAEVNSFHHQAIHRIGSGLRAVAWSPDGVIEGIEAPARDFVVGVQWHAESLVELREQARLFRGLVEAANRFEGRDAGARAA
ncbi:MAG TPA: gamma-glutamyl-gamma-aminobutyrate hydrolase family protein [Thermoleophilaceae bacterium]|nr:gamma-glutamyl-gamma-aminobutyrate hydrolase family protein [Thermoleophilaceae bacterium]